MTLIVSDNSHLNLSVCLGVADILPALFQQVFIPPQVAAEMGHAKAPSEVRAFIAAPPNWLIVRPPNFKAANNRPMTKPDTTIPRERTEPKTKPYKSWRAPHPKPGCPLSLF